jgi:exosome complex component RRP41
MAKVGAPEKLIIDGKRLDGRELDGFRKMTSEARVLKNADGSGSFSFGETRAIAGVFGPKPMHPRHLQNPQKTVLRCKYAMAPFSTGDRIRPGPNRRSTEISKVTTEAFSSVLFHEDFPRTAIDVFIDIIQADASTRCAGINAASLALADAAIPMRDLISSCSVGKVDGQLVLDVAGKEDMYGDVDFAVATISDTDRFVLLQLDGVITREEFTRMLIMGQKGCTKVYNQQKAALRTKYATAAEGE